MTSTIKRTLKMSVCFILIFALCIGFMSTATIQPKASAEAITLSLGAYAILATILGMLGITISSPQILKDLSSAITDGSSAIKDWLEDMAENATGGGTDPDGNKVPNKFTMNLAGTAGFAALVNKIKGLFGDKANSGFVSVPDISTGFYGNTQFAYATRSQLQAMTPEQTYALAPYTSNVYNTDIEHGYHVYVNNSDFSFYFRGSAADYFRLYRNGAYCYSGSYSGFDIYPKHISNYASCVDCRFGFYINVVNETTYLIPFIATKVNLSSGAFGYANNLTLIEQKFWVAIDGAGVTPAMKNFPYNNISDYAISSIYKALLDKLQAGDLQIDYTEQLDYMTANQNEALNISQEQLLEMVGIRTALESLLAQQAEPSKTTLDEKDLDVPNLPSSIADKFPFCVPFDLIHLIGALNSTAVDPVWTIPFVIPSLGINESFTFDLTQFETVAQVIRVFVVLFFILGLILITRKIIQA